MIVVTTEQESQRSTNTGWLVSRATQGAWLVLRRPRTQPAEGERHPLPELPTNALVLFPGEPRELDTSDIGRPLVLVDADYRRARRMLRRAPLRGLERVSLPRHGMDRPRYELRQSGDPERLCTLGAAAGALQALGADGSARELNALLGAFQDRAMRLRLGAHAT